MRNRSTPEIVAMKSILWSSIGSPLVAATVDCPVVSVRSNIHHGVPNEFLTQICRIFKQFLPNYNVFSYNSRVFFW